MRSTNTGITIVAGIVLAACGKRETPAADTTTPAAATAPAPASGEQARRNAGYEDAGIGALRCRARRVLCLEHQRQSVSARRQRIHLCRASGQHRRGEDARRGRKEWRRAGRAEGTAIVGDTLWVTDINHLRAFNSRTGAKVADIDLSSQNAMFLNDVAGRWGRLDLHD